MDIRSSTIAIFLTLSLSGSVALGPQAMAQSRRADVATVTGQVMLTGKSGSTHPAQAGVVVYFESAPVLDAVATTPVVRTIKQRNRMFEPTFVAIPRGGVIEFPNDDRVFHNVFSLSSTQRFDLGLYRDGQSRKVKMKRSGVVDVYCNIHPEMTATIKVVPNSFYTLTDRKGRFQIADVPPGSYTIAAWNGNESSKAVEIGSGSVEVELSLPAAQKRKKRHRRKDGTPYRRYR